MKNGKNCRIKFDLKAYAQKNAKTDSINPFCRRAKVVGWEPDALWQPHPLNPPLPDIRLGSLGEGDFRSASEFAWREFG